MITPYFDQERPKQRWRLERGACAFRADGGLHVHADSSRSRTMPVASPSVRSSLPLCDLPAILVQSQCVPHRARIHVKTCRRSGPDDAFGT